MTRKTRSDSHDAAKQALQAASCTIAPPDGVTLRAEDAPYWLSVTTAKPKEAWNDADLTQAAWLARALCDIQRLQNEIDTEGDILDGRINRKHVLVETLTRRVISLTRVLQLNSRSRNGETRDLAPAKRAAAAAKQGLRLVGNDGLIPGIG